MSRASRRRAKKERRLARQHQQNPELPGLIHAASQTLGQAARKVQRAFQTGPSRCRRVLKAPLKTVVPDAGPFI